MIVNKKSVSYEVSIKRGDPVYESHGIDNVSYARIDGEWRHNTGGSIFDWRSCQTHICKCGCGYSKGELLEVGFQKTQRNEKINQILNDV
jgi:hypothetical protein